MGKLFIKMNNERYEKVDKETGEISELQQTLVFDEDKWFQLYSNVFLFALKDVNSLVDIKVFAACLKCSMEDEKYGNIVETGERLKRCINEYVPLKQPALSRSLKNLCENGFLIKLSRSSYQINPQIAYCGSRHSKSKLILNLIKQN